MRAMKGKSVIGKPIYEEVADFALAAPNGVTRADVARKFGVTKTTATVHLEKCVQRGMLRKVYAWVGEHSRGWAYLGPDVPFL